MVNTNWGGVVEDNSFGTHEFMELCRQIGCEAYINANVGSGTVQEIAEWVEYLNSDTDSTISMQRRANGHDAPLHVKFWGVGNEQPGAAAATCAPNITPTSTAAIRPTAAITARTGSTASPAARAWTTGTGPKC